MSQSIFHGIPPNMEGDVLYPLNQLKDIYPNAYNDAVSKYEGREQLLERKVPILNCLWNDVLHLSPVHPAYIKQAYIDAGFNPEFKTPYFQIDPRTLDISRMAVYLYTNLKNRLEVREEDFVPFEFDLLPKLSELRPETADYFKTKFIAGERPLIYAGVPHVLHLGPIDTAQDSITRIEV